jgi:hypothetical protein
MEFKDNNKYIPAAIIVGLIILIGAFFYVQHVRNVDKSNQTQTQQSIAPSTPNNPPSNPNPSPPPSDKDANGCYTPDTVRNHYGETACVDFNVGYVYEDSAGTKFIDQLTNYTSGFVGYVPYNSDANDIDLSQLDGKNIKITGYIQQYDGYPEIVVNELSQVQIYN